MTDRLPTCTPRQVLAALQRAGWRVIKIKGSHHRLEHPENPALRITLPLRRGDMPRRTLNSVLKQARISEEEFRALL
jgi:predicted RNA binding protein YcfA (HicA-like mRNA interferase family)